MIFAVALGKLLNASAKALAAVSASAPRRGVIDGLDGRFSL